MKLAHSAVISVFSKPEENYQEIKDCLIRFVGLDLEKEKLKIDEKKASFDGFTIIILSITLDKGKHVQQFLDMLNEKISAEEKELLVKQYLTRVDDDLNFFLRLEKKALIANELKLTDGGECFHIKIHLACYPAKVELGKEAVKQIFK
jgi:RNA binding exosome subunit